jgi:hypothetical protein
MIFYQVKAIYQLDYFIFVQSYLIKIYYLFFLLIIYKLYLITYLITETRLLRGFIVLYLI